MKTLSITFRTKDTNGNQYYDACLFHSYNTLKDITTWGQAILFKHNINSGTFEIIIEKEK